MIEIDVKLQKIRLLMKESNYDAYIIPHSDAHDNEYLASADERVKFISGFSGSNALCVITQTEALCWTDGRYFIQCEKQLLPGWKIKKMGQDETSRQYLIKNLASNSKIGINFMLISNETYDLFASTLKDHQLINNENDLVDRIWIDSKDELKPQYKKESVIIHELKYTGETCSNKYDKIFSTFVNKNEIKENITSVNKYAFIISKLDDIAWMCNLRGSDIEFNPVFFSYAVLFYNKDEKKGNVKLFSDLDKFNTDEIKCHLIENNIDLMEYNQFYTFIQSKNQELNDWVVIGDKISINQNVYDCISNNLYKCYIENINFTEHTKCYKNDIELKGFKDCHIRDGAALVRYFAWLEHELCTKNSAINEYDASLKSLEFRSHGSLFKGESFSCISSTGSNAAIIHYKPEENNSHIINKDHLYLCDSGAQYLDGTTDTTRTLYFNTETANNLKNREKEMYTRVLLGNIAIERSIMNKRSKLSGKDMDSLARQYLWQVGEDYMHGTGHGVGHFLNVHEGPNGIGGYPGNPSFEKGLVMSNEPGYYLKDNYGIRIENIIYVDNVISNDNLLKFNNLTMVPYEKNLIDINLLSKNDIDYINKYHEQCYNTLSNLLEEYEDYVALNYLKRKTSPI